MARLNVKTTRPVSPLVSSVVSGVTTYEGGQGVVSDSKTELFRLGVNLFYSEKTFYEKGANRSKRFIDLVEKLAVSDAIWTMGFLIWLRSTANIRTASVVGAAHFVHARLASPEAVKEDELLSSLGYKGVNRHIISQVLSRADEPGEFVSYWLSRFGKLPKPVKRGIADSVIDLYNEYSVMKYDTASHDIRFADVLNMTHAKPRAAANLTDRLPAWKLAEMSEEDILAYTANAHANKVSLFKYIIDKRYSNDDSSYDLSMINENAAFRKEAAEDVTVLLDAERVKAAGMTWEDVLSLGGSKLNKAKLWESAIPSMGVFALVRNLRNFEEAGISREARDYVISQLTNPKVIAKSRMFPFRFLSAFQETNSLQYHAALETAIELSTQNVPVLDGYTLVLIDTSGSMDAAVSDKSKMTRAGIGALFGAAIAAKNPGKVDLVMFASTSKKLNIKPGTSILKIVEEVNRRNGEVGHGTQTADALKQHFDPAKHNRVIINTDGQSFPATGYYGYSYGVANFNFGKAYAYSFDLAGYKVTDLPTGKDRKFQLGGYSDATFRLIPMLEQGQGSWPWEG